MTLIEDVDLLKSRRRFQSPEGGRVSRLYSPERIPGGIENQFENDNHELRMAQIALLSDCLL